MREISSSPPTTLFNQYSIVSSTTILTLPILFSSTFTNAAILGLRYPESHPLTSSRYYSLSNSEEKTTWSNQMKFRLGLRDYLLFDHVLFETFVFTNRPSVGSWMDLDYRFLFTPFAHVCQVNRWTYCLYLRIMQISLASPRDRTPGQPGGFVEWAENQFPPVVGEFNKSRQSPLVRVFFNEKSRYLPPLLSFEVKTMSPILLSQRAEKPIQIALFSQHISLVSRGSYPTVKWINTFSGVKVIALSTVTVRNRCGFSLLQKKWFR